MCVHHSTIPRVLLASFLFLGSANATTPAWAELERKPGARSLSLAHFSTREYLLQESTTGSIRGDDEQPTLDTKSTGSLILGGVLGGLAGAVAGGATGWVIGYNIDPDVDYTDPAGYPAAWGLFIGAPVGYVLGSAIGVYSVGDTPTQTGDFLATFGGSVIGGVLGLALAGVGFFPGAPIGAAVGFNLTANPEPPVESKSVSVRTAETIETEGVVHKQTIAPIGIRPAFDMRRAAGETFAGMGAGLLVGGLGAVLFGFTSNQSSGFDQDRGATGFLVSYSLGSAVGVYSAGDTPTETGNLLVTLGCSALGALVSHALGMEGASVVLSPVGATIGFNITRAYKQNP